MNQNNNFFTNKYAKKVFGFIALSSVAFAGMMLFTRNSELDARALIYDNLKIALFIGFLLVFINPPLFKWAEKWIFKTPSEK